MLKSLFTGVSGLNAMSMAMGTIGNNIANVNTVGFKGMRNLFADLLASSVGKVSIGGGVRLSSTTPSFSQGSIITTGNTTDLAIDGDGFFIIDTGDGTYYSRSGIFLLDADGYLVTPEGYKVQGWQLDENGTINSTLSDINLANIMTAAKATSTVKLKTNLNAEADIITAAFDWNDPSTYNYSTTLTVYDSLGKAHAISVYFVKTADNTWDAHYVYVDGTGTTVEASTTQTITFNSDGSLDDDNSGTAINFSFGGGAASPQAIYFDYGTGTSEGGTGLDGSTQYATPFSTNFLGQDGYTAGDLKSISINEDGIIEGLFSNGQVRNLYQIALADFVSPWNLIKIGDNLFAETGASGQPIIDVPNTGGRGKIISGALEMSNVDLATEFTNLILVQRAFQANARVITTSDEMLTELVNLKR